ncbi:MAG: acetylornithine/succinylornithine family transaminase [Burkholderiales bacterium]|nr:acetylornithine/succinylornithine family transaminase [Phycisphaerae bacterium]
MSDTQKLLRRAGEVLIQNYGRSPVVMARGEGTHVWDTDGRKYLDLFAGFGGAILGHCHPELVEAATAQARKLWHVGNALYSEPQIEFAERLKKHAFDGRAFFCHSGLEANEAAIKLARLRGLKDGGKKWKTISLMKSFHGRSLAMIAATGNPAVKDGFGPAVPGFANIDANDYGAIEAAVDDETCSIIMEPIQGEGGINVYPPGHVAKVRALCDARGLTLIFDEVWTGCGRTGRWFAHQYDGVTPDIMTLGKAVGGGLPVGVMFAVPEIAALLVPGKHGCTLGGNAICMAVSRTIFDVIERDDLVQHAANLGEAARAKFKSSSAVGSKVAEVRGRGLFIGIELAAEPVDFVAKSLAKGLITNITSKKVIRLAPPINISAAEWDQGVDRVIDLIASL